jgi:large subunit ribosomal protein L21|tara:strand:+ start:813 stop:1133 length:321 start_codon:yes stop_codon:yes gene_type:complete
MTDYAIIKTGGKQYRVRQGDTVNVEKLNGEIGDSVTLSEVLMTSLEGSLQVGSPVVENATVAAEITDHGRGEKLTVFKYKNKTRSRVKKGHRQQYTSLLIQGISIK